MLRIMCKSKIHKATITKTKLDYEGSIGIDKRLLEASNIYPNEIVYIFNLNNGLRFETYVIEEPSGSGDIVLYGPAARLGQVGDSIIIMSTVLIESKEVQALKPKIVYVDKNNKIVKK